MAVNSSVSSLPEARELRTVRKRITIGGLLVVLSGFLMPFDDIALLADVAGGLSKSPAWIPLACAALILPKPQSPAGVKAERVLAFLWLLGATVTVATMLVNNQTANASGSFRVGFILLIFLTVMRCGIRAAEHCSKSLQAAFLISLIILMASAILDGAVEQMTLLHDTSNFAQRVRGTRFEASSLGAGLLIATAGIALAVRRIPGLIAVIGMAFVILAVTQSRGTLASIAALLFAALLAMLPWNSRTTWWSKALATAVAASALLAAFGLQHLLLSPAWAGMSAAFSDATRSVWSHVSATSLLTFPVGQGYGGTGDELRAMVLAAAQELSNRFPVSDMSESLSVATDPSGNALAPKTLLALTAVYWGIPGVALLAYAFWQMTTAAYISKEWGRGAFVACVIVVVVTSSYFSTPFAWDQAILLGALIGASAIRRELSKETGAY